MRRSLILLLWCASPVCLAQTQWIEESNKLAAPLLETAARYNPELSVMFGVEQYDDDVIDLKPGNQERAEADYEAAALRLEQVREKTTDPRVRQDIDLMISAARDRRASSQINASTCCRSSICRR